MDRGTDRGTDRRTDSAPDPTAFGRVLRALRLAASLTQASLAERAGLSVRGIQLLESGARRPHQDTVERLVRGLALSVKDRKRLVALAQSAPHPDSGLARGGKTLLGLPPSLPLQVTSFVGREREIAEVKRLLGTTRLLTLTGTGGCGKTRLAYQVAADLLESYPDGIRVVELAALSDPELVGQTVAQVLGLHQDGREAILSLLIGYLRPRRLLLVLDNCEHLLDACASLVNALLLGCPNLTVFATSRESLGVPGETSWRVPSLTVPPREHYLPPAVVGQYEAVRLFVERARTVQPAFEVNDEDARAMAQVCWRLDGIPLALELAAARVRVLTVEQIASRLDDRFRLLTGGSRMAVRRQQTLRASVDWSYDLLSEAERVLLRRLAVFAGGCTLEAAEGVCAGDGLEEDEILDLLTQLVDKSLVTVDQSAAEPRYRLLETVRQYAWEKQVDSGEATAVRDAHRDWYVAFAERAAPELVAPDQERWYRRVAIERDNFRVALEWCRDDPEGAEAELRLAAALGRYFGIQHCTEGRTWLRAALARAGSEVTMARAQALNCLGQVERFVGGDLGVARQLGEEAVAIARQLGAPRLLDVTLRQLAGTLLSCGEAARARALCEEALAVAREVDDTREVGMALVYLGQFFCDPGDRESATRLLTEGLALGQRLDDKVTIAQGLAGLGEIAIDQGDHARARHLLERSLGAWRSIADVDSSLVILAWLSDIARIEGDRSAAQGRYRELLRTVRDRANEVANEVVVAALLLVRLAGLAAEGGCFERAARLFGAAQPRYMLDHWYRLLYCPPHVQRMLDTDEAAAREALGEAGWARAYAEGQAMTLDQAGEYALQDVEWAIAKSALHQRW